MIISISQNTIMKNLLHFVNKLNSNFIHENPQGLQYGYSYKLAIFSLNK